VILDAHLAGRIELDFYRGRSIYPFAVQAAEREVRRTTGLTGIGDLVLRSAEQVDEKWNVVFQTGGEQHAVEVEPELGDFTYLTCSAPAVRRPRHFPARSR
jgi:hypothetical protein